MRTTVDFPALTFEAPGVYDFTIKELTPPCGGCLPDKRVCPCVVTVKNIEGILEALVEFPQGDPVFTTVCRPPMPPHRPCCRCCRCGRCRNCCRCAGFNSNAMRQALAMILFAGLC